jgi:hypothetical protein
MPAFMMFFLLLKVWDPELEPIFAFSQGKLQA